MKARSASPSASSTCSTAAISTASVPGRTGIHSASSRSTVRVRRGSSTTTGTPCRRRSRRRASSSQPKRVSTGLAPQRRMRLEWRSVAASSPACFVPNRYGETKSAAALLKEPVVSVKPPQRWRKRAVSRPVWCSAPRQEPEPPTCIRAAAPCRSRRSASRPATFSSASAQPISLKEPDPRGPDRSRGRVSRCGEASTSPIR